MKTRHKLVGVLGLLVAGCGGSNSSPPPPPAVNAAPSVSAVMDQSTTANTPSSQILFTVSDEQPANLSITASSDNQSVIADSAIVLGGSDTSRSLTVTPTFDALGDAFITIIATDTAGLLATTSFLLTVVPQQVSILQFTRATFADDEAGDPELINAIAFGQDADGDDFADLLAQ